MSCLRKRREAREQTGTARICKYGTLRVCANKRSVFHCAQRKPDRAAGACTPCKRLAVEEFGVGGKSRNPASGTCACDVLAKQKGTGMRPSIADASRSDA